MRTVPVAASQAVETASASKHPPKQILRYIGLGIITGASDDDPSAIGTYASAGAKFGPFILWAAPVLLPMMITVVYLSSKLGQVAGQGLFEAVRAHYPRWLLYSLLGCVLVGNIFEAGADIAGMSAGLNLLIPLPIAVLAVPITVAIVALQTWGSYTLIRNIFRWLSLALLAYVVAAFLSRPQLVPVIKGTLLPHIRFNKEFLPIIVALIGTSLSAYLYTWQSNVEVEEKIARGQCSWNTCRGTSREELARTRMDVSTGMFFANLVMYFIMLSMWPLYQTGQNDISSAAQAAAALEPLAGRAAGLLFAIGIVAIGFLAVPVMTTGAAYDLCQSVGWKCGLNLKPREAKAFYVTIAVSSVIGMCLSFTGINVIRLLVWAGIVQGLSTPVLLVLILLMTNSRTVMGKDVNGWKLNLLGSLTALAVFGAAVGLVITWIR